MFIGSAKELTDLARVFTVPANATHRRYEALRAYFVGGLSGVEAARRFGYTPGSFRVLVHQFRPDPGRPFVHPPAGGPAARPQTRPRPGRDRPPAKPNPLDLRHHPPPARRGAPPRPGPRPPGSKARGVPPPPPPRR